MLTPRRIVMAARLGFVMASLGMAVLMLGPFQGLEQVFGLNDKTAHGVAFYGVTTGLFLIAPRQRRDDLALFVVAAAFAGMSRVERQRLVYRVLAEELAGGVHALALATLAPAEADGAGL